MPPQDLPDDVWIGIDLGTSGVRVLAVTADGTVVGSGRQPLDSSRDGCRHEQDPEQWWQATVAACRSAVDTVPEGAVRGMAVAATSGTVLLIDQDGRPLTPALMYDDTRAGHLVSRVNEIGGNVWEELGYRRMQPAWALPKLLWLLAEHAEVAATAELAHQSDFINRRLVGAPVATDLSSALKTGAHLIDAAWPSSVLDDLAVPASTLPDLVLPGSQLGSVSPDAAEATGIPAGTAVVAGMTDGCAAQLGAGAVAVGSWNSTLGTTLVIKGVSAQLLRDPHGVVYSHRAPGGGWLPGGASSTGAGALTREFGGRDLADLDRQALGKGPPALIAYPLVSTGERFPFVEPGARGFVLGEPSGQEELYSALLHGVAYVERLCFDYLDLLGADLDGDLYLTGGAAKSLPWCQLRADVMARPVKLPENAEPAIGMAVLAAAQERPLAEISAEMLRVGETIEPTSGTRGRHDEAYLHLVQELEDRGWLPPPVASHARERTPR